MSAAGYDGTSSANPVRTDKHDGDDAYDNQDDVHETAVPVAQ